MKKFKENYWRRINDDILLNFSKCGVLWCVHTDRTVIDKN